VLEIGCYLGGSTAAIARGLDAAGATNRLYVLDSFSWQNPGFISHLSQDIHKLENTFTLSPEAVEATRTGDWSHVFHEVHRIKPYFQRLSIHKACIPYESADPFELGRYVPPVEAIGAAFIDGFKSWQCTYSAMTALVPYLRPGSLLIFQDFSWFDCYWLPVLAEHFGAGAELYMKVDNTAVFKIHDTERLAASIESLGPQYDPGKYQIYQDLLARWASAMFHSGDEIGFILHTAQSYVLAVTAGNRNDASAKLAFLDKACTRLGMAWLLDSLKIESFTIH
jgi:hypothetical protein